MRKLCLFISAFVLACSCSREDDLPLSGDDLSGGDPLEVVFHAGRSGKGWNDSGGSGTRVTESGWVQDDRIGIYMLAQNAGVPDYDLSNPWKANRQYRITDASTGAMTPVADTDKLVFPRNGDRFNFVAYYPWSVDAGSADAGKVNKVTVDFTGQANGTASKDFLFHRDAADVSYNNGNRNLALTFYHKFAKIVMTVKSEGSPDLTGLTQVKLTGMPGSATVDLTKLTHRQSSDSIQNGAVGDILAYIAPGATTAQATVEAIVAPQAGVAGRTYTFTVGNDVYTYEVNENFAFESGKVYTYEFTLKSGIVNTTSDGMTNCYMVAPGTGNSVTFPVKRAYADATTLRTGDEYTGGFNAEVIWQDPANLGVTVSVDSGTGSSANVTVGLTTTRSGNAVVKIYKSTDMTNKTPVWSYHIWVTDPDAIVPWENTNQPGYIFMDRNLGATEAANSIAGRGLLYQWGRKDPFPGGPGKVNANEGAAGYAVRTSFAGIDGDSKLVTGTAYANSTDKADQIIRLLAKLKKSL